MEIVKDPRFDWLGKKFIFIGASLLLVAAGAASLLTRGLGLSVDFTGGSLVFVKFKETPDLERIRSVMADPRFRTQGITRFDEPSENQVQIRMGLAGQENGSDSESSQQSAGPGDVRRLVYDVLQKEFDPEYAATDKLDLNQAGRAALRGRLAQLDPDSMGATVEDGQDARLQAESLAGQIVDYRTRNGGLIQAFPELESLALPTAVMEMLQAEYYLGSFNLRSVESVGPQVGSELRDRAQAAVIASLIGMLVYIWFRFQLVYGVAAIIALFHDVFITLGIFSISGKEISLTVIAGLLTLVGYSLNDTIVVFDRMRENLNQMRRKPMSEVINLSINQTLNRTILTSATFLMAALALYILGGEALDGFSFTLVIGVLVGTFSSVAIASPIVFWWDQKAGRKRR
ncbi:MAG: protein translocase subunit SecF [Acidobacteriota bacterium]